MNQLASFSMAAFVAGHLVCASPVLAQGKGAAALEGLAACTVGHPKWRNEASAFLSLSQFSLEYTEQLKTLVWNEECDDHFKGMISFTPETFRKVLFDAWKATRPDGEELNVTMMQMLADCLVLSSPELVAGFVETVPGSAAEEASIAQLAQKLPSCVDQGASLNLTKASLREVLTSTAALAKEVENSKELKAEKDA